MRLPFEDSTKKKRFVASHVPTGKRVRNLPNMDEYRLFVGKTETNFSLWQSDGTDNLRITIELREYSADEIVVVGVSGHSTFRASTATLSLHMRGDVWRAEPAGKIGRGLKD